MNCTNYILSAYLIAFFSINVVAQKNPGDSKAVSPRNMQVENWVVTDALGRKLPGFEECGPVKKTKDPYYEE